MTEVAKLIVMVGEEINKSFDLIKSEIVIGRDPSNDIVIDDIEISRNHLKITKTGEGLVAEDLKSTNGTQKNGKPLRKPTILLDGDLITLGTKHVLEFKAESQDDALSDEEPLNEKMTEDKTPASEAEAEINLKKKKVKAEKKDKETVKPIKEKKERKSNFLKDKPTWLVVLISALVFIVIFCVVPLIVIEVTNQWCNLFAGFFNSMSPGVCP